MSLFDHLLPNDIVVVGSSEERDYPIADAESQAMRQAVASRRREFVTGRWCAAQALRVLGARQQEVHLGRAGAPAWPPGVVGSITHCEGYRAAAVGWARDVYGLGIDAEPASPLPDEVRPMVLSLSERAHHQYLPAGDIPWDRVAFSAKESVYKVWYPLTGKWLDFLQADIRLDPSGTFSASLSIDGPVAEVLGSSNVRGRWRCAQGLVLTALALPVLGG